MFIASKQTNAGLTLVELCIALVIVGIILSSQFSWIEAQSYRKSLETTRQNLAVVHHALQEYYARNQRYPCPASAAIMPTVQGFYREADCHLSPLPEGILVIPGIHQGKFAAIGRVPSRTLGLADHYGLDGWGVHLVYVVSQVLTGKDGDAVLGNLYEKGTLNVLDGAGDVIADPPALYVVFSSGPDRRGQFLPSGVFAEDCRLGSYDGRNCDADPIFIRELRSDADGETYYDDMLIYDRDITAMGDSILRNTLEKLVICQRRGAFFDPLDPYADESGCLSAVMPSGSCAHGLVVGGVESSGQIRCIPNMQPGYCQGGRILIGYDEIGKAICSDLLMQILSCAQIGLIYAGQGHAEADAQGCRSASVAP